MAGHWGALFEEAKQLAAARARLDVDPTGPVGILDEIEENAVDTFMSQIGEEEPTGPTGVWSRKIVYDMVKNLKRASAIKGFSILGTLEVARIKGDTASHFHSARFDWLRKILMDLPDRRRTAEEIAARYFTAALGDVDSGNLQKAVGAILTAIHNYFSKAYKDLEDENVHYIVFAGARFTQKVDFSALRIDLIVAVGLMLPTDMGGRGTVLNVAMEYANQSTPVGRGLLPFMVHQGTGPLELRADTVTIELEWVSSGAERTHLRSCQVEAGVFYTNPTVYNSGISAPSIDILGGPHTDAVESAEWVTVIMSVDQLIAARVEDQEITVDGTETWVPSSATLQDSLRECQAATWLATARYGVVRIRCRGSTWTTCANNLIVNDIGDGTTPTYGSTCCATIRIYGYKMHDKSIGPVVPSVQYILNEAGWAPEIAALKYGYPAVFPLILDAKTLSCLPVLFTILAKMRSLADNRDRALIFRHASKITLSSSFGLASPNDIYNHIDFILSCMTALEPFIDLLNTLTIEEQDAIANNVRKSATLAYSGRALENLRKGRSSAAAFFSKSENAAYTCAFAWATVESATCIVWLVTYLASGLSPVAYQHTYRTPPVHGVQALKFLLKLSFRQWVDYDALTTPSVGRGIGNADLRLLIQLIHGEAALVRKLAACKTMIRESPNF